MARKPWKIIFTSLLFNLVFSLATFSQDTLELRTITISSYPLTHTNFQHTSATETLTRNLILKNPGEGLTESMNLFPGIRMEERSPGSYRISIRGSLLRSPFGVRNVKFYLDDYPLTDAGGNTYLNLADKRFFNSIEVIKGPDGSFYGANTGGAIILKTKETADSVKADLYTSLASYNTLYTGAGLKFNFKKLSSRFLLSRYVSDGYRENSSIKRCFFISSNDFRYNEKNTLGITTFISALDYETPGGLTLEQALAEPKEARPAAGKFKSAIEQNAGVENKTYFIGISNRHGFGTHGSFTVALSYSNTEFKNPFITNYETRDEQTFSFRSILRNKFVLLNKKFEYTAGLEGQRTYSRIYNFGNNKGVRDTLQAADEVIYLQGLLFAGISSALNEKLSAELSASINTASIGFRQLPSNGEKFTQRVFPSGIMPRLAFIYSFSENANARASVSNGYSLPTLSEIRPGTTIISQTLLPERGLNYELGFRTRTKGGRFLFNLTGYYFRLSDAIVRRLDENENEYFINAGGTLQPGVEASVNAEMMKLRQTGFIRFISFSTSYTFNRFKFTDYLIDNNNYSGNDLTGTPRNVSSNVLSVVFVKNISIEISHYYCSAIPLRDDNSVVAYSYNLINASINKIIRYNNLRVEISSGVKNIFNAFYSSGNDLNAPGGRYFNPSPLRNYFISVALNF